MTNQTQTAQTQEKVVIALTPQISKRVDKKVREELVKQYRKLFAGFAWAKWAKKHSWGRAWQSGINLNGAMIMIAKKIMTPNNQAVKYLENVHAAYKKHWSKMAMTHPERETKTIASDKNLKKMHAHAVRMINDATNAIMDILRKYNERLKEMVIEQMAEKQQASTKQKQPEQAQTQDSNAPEHQAQPATPVPQAQPVMGATQSAAAPAAAKPAVAMPEVARPAAAKPAVTIPEVVRPAVAKPAVAMPEVARPAVAKPVVATPEVARPAVAKPVVAMPEVARPAVAKPAVAMPEVARPAVAKRTYSAPQIAVNDVKSHTRNVAPVAKAQKPYEAPTIKERANVFEVGANRIAIKQANERLQIQRRINIFTITQSQQKVA
ncbi:MAG: hypothetical protein E7006_03530 [Alphaproteobacteria bacterium]|nr:hypothetical protein [Alphaproteobacteria bacterium]